jgi:hypothetical protein
MRRRQSIGILALLVAAAVIWAAPPAPESTASPVTGEVCWSELVFKARKLLLSATAILRFEQLEPGDTQLREVPKGVSFPVGESRILHVSMRNQLPFGRDEKVSAWLDSGSGAALQSEKLVTGSKQYWKLRRYGQKGFFQWRSEPSGKAEKKLDRASWTRTSDYWVHWDQSPPEGVAVSDSYALLYLISAARLDQPGTSLKTVIFSKKKLVELEFKPGRRLHHKVSYTEKRSTTSKQRSGKIWVREVKGTGKPLSGGGDGKDVDLGFLGMQGELTVLLEEGTGIPIEVQGRADNIGKLRVVLQQVTLQAPPEEPKP